MFKYLLVGMYLYSVLPVQKRAMCMCQSRCIMKIMKNDEAVSPVIGVILMVAITVILAAVIAAFVFGLAGTTQTTRTVGLTLSLNQTYADDFNIVFTGGADLSSLAGFAVNYDGAPVNLTTNDASTPGTNLVRVDTTVSPRQVKPDGTNAQKFSVGETVYVSTGSPISGHRVTIIGYFTDGGTQILWDRTL